MYIKFLIFKLVILGSLPNKVKCISPVSIDRYYTNRDDLIFIIPQYILRYDYLDKDSMMEFIILHSVLLEKSCCHMQCFYDVYRH